MRKLFMWKTKVFLIAFIVLLLSIIQLLKIEAHSVELDSNSLISFQMIISNGKGTITIKSTESGYTLYYQAVEISNTIYLQIDSTGKRI